MVADQPSRRCALFRGRRRARREYLRPQGRLPGRHTVCLIGVPAIRLATRHAGAARFRTGLVHVCLRKLVRVSSMADSSAVTKAVVPAAGLGTRFLPATKATPKEMLPIVDKPAIQYVVEEAVAAGLDDVLLITGRASARSKTTLTVPTNSRRRWPPRTTTDGLAQVRESAELATVHYVRQGEPRGLGHAVLCAARHVGNEPFAVLLGDDLIDPRDPLLTRMIEVRERFGGSVVALMEVPRSRSRCTAAPRSSRPTKRRGDDHRPGGEAGAGQRAGRWIIIGRYVCDPKVFDVLRQTPPGRGGEIQLTDALKILASDPASGGVYGVLFRGRRYDTGNKLDYLRTVVTFASERPDLAQEFVPWLRAYLESRP